LGQHADDGLPELDVARVLGSARPRVFDELGESDSERREGIVRVGRHDRPPLVAPQEEVKACRRL
jgi:hypothetical protein